MRESQGCASSSEHRDSLSADGWSLLLNWRVSSLSSRESGRALSAAGSSRASENGTPLKDRAVNTCCVSKAKLFLFS